MLRLLLRLLRLARTSYSSIIGLARYPEPMASINLRVTSDLDKAAAFTNAMAKQLAFATAGALNNTAFDARESLSGATRQYFQNPTPFTQKGFQVEKANKATLLAKVGAEQKRARYLRTEITGGIRPWKRFEGRYQVGQVVPAAIKLNASGNVSKAAIVKLASQATMTGNGSVMIGTPKGGDRPAGIYRRSGRGGRDKLVPLFLAVESPTYQARFPMLDVVNKVITRRYGDYFRSSLERALASAR